MSMTKTGPAVNESMPPGGWVRELVEAQKVVRKREKKNKTVKVSSLLRVARAAAKLRQWEVCHEASERGLQLHPTPEESQPLSICLNISKAELGRPSMLREKEFREARSVIANVRPPFINYTKLQFQDRLVTGCGFTNLHLMHTAALRGDVVLLEELVALGLALDIPLPPSSRLIGISESERQKFDQFPAPVGSTPLLLACAVLARNQIQPPLMSVQDASDIADCAVRLVKLGANTQVRLVLSGHPLDLDPWHLARVGFHGKTAQQLAKRSGNNSLIRVMKLFANQDNAINLTQCRCGSRLPWKQCHASSRNDTCHQMNEDGTLSWRYSPLARCPCGLEPVKSYFDCCWNSSDPHYLKDQTGSIYRGRVMSFEVVDSIIESLDEGDPFRVMLENAKEGGTASGPSAFAKTNQGQIIPGFDVESGTTWANFSDSRLGSEHQGRDHEKNGQ